MCVCSFVMERHSFEGYSKDGVRCSQLESLQLSSIVLIAIVTSYLASYTTVRRMILLVASPLRCPCEFTPSYIASYI